ncbi:hypothetical protein GJ633_09925 [Halorubrum sp. CBA1125]|uniref:hypothetical protein n=1 Tax=Halorubrum sp. CBA1125 TaxID=2668072 RepID=UPI0012E7CEFB|nr:hypothetical protein [Halorubrum sp. CBA1125]MUW14946.1 hypothetical protein [Halorubrum sp. CBA1125]
MQRTRRDLLAAGSVAVGLAGCLGVDGVTYPDESDPDDGPDADDGADGGDGDDAPDEPPDEDDEEVPVPNPALADATRAVVDDAVWFASTYEAAIDVYLDATGDVLEAVTAVRERIHEPTDPTTEMAARLESAGYAAADRAAEALEPHFYPHDLLRERTDRHVPALTRSARRNDADRFVEELDRMHGSFSRIRTPIYVAGTFSRDPIHNRLLDRLAPGDPDDVLVELAVPSRRRFATLAHEPYPDDDETFPPEFTADPLPEARRESIRERLGPVLRSDGRTEELFVAFAPRPEPADSRTDAFRGPPDELDGTPLHVQRYADVRTATARLTAVLEAGATEGREPLLPDVDAADDALEWHRYYHREEGSDRTGLDEFPGVQYGYVLQAGEFLLATGFSGDAWEERPNWQGRLADAWVTA